MNLRSIWRVVGPLALVLGCAAVPRAEAAPFLLTADLTGDARAENPDNLLVHVTVSGDDTSNLTTWTIDLDSSQYPDLKLGGFFFNLANPAGTTLSFLDVSPSAWTISTTSQSAQGSGGAVFEFRSLDPPGSSNNVTNTTNLTFTARLNGALWTPDMLFNAPLSDGDGIPDPGAQLGAHLQSATAPCSTGCSDSGFASGSFAPTSRVPEPGTMALFGLGIFAAATARRRRA